MKQKTILFIRSALFSVFFIILTSSMLVLFSPLLLIRGGNAGDIVGRTWSSIVVWTLKYMVGINYEVRGLENVPKDKVFIIACKHESMWETMIMHPIFYNPVFILKRQLTWVPFFGWHLGNSNHISVNRGGAMQALKSTIKQAKVYLDEGHNLIIFPQGTRVPPEATTEKYPYKSGVAGIFSATKYPVIPTALNSGYFWGKRKFLKKPGTIVVEFMKPIYYKEGFDKNKFMKELEDKIETKSRELLEEAKRKSNLK